MDHITLNTYSKTKKVQFLYKYTLKNQDDMRKKTEHSQKPGKLNNS